MRKPRQGVRTECDVTGLLLRLVRRGGGKGLEVERDGGYWVGRGGWILDREQGCAY